jgi:vitamin B12/bleomycin/antimicrobial peptide transport system ATP-binding/permease protein
MPKDSDISAKAPPEAEITPRYSIKEQLRSLKPFWVSDQKKKAWWMLGGIVALTVAEIALTAGVGLGFKVALDALVAKNAATFALSGGATLAGIGASALAGNGREYIQLHLSQNWRGWLTKQFNDAWLNGKSYLRLQHDKKYVQNPDQRIAETVGNVTGTTLGLALGLFRSVLSVATFGFMLWHISPLMLVAAVVCAGGAHAATHWAGGSMRKIWRGLMDTEAKFRHALTRVRDNAKTIALTGYEPVEKETLKDQFNALDAKRREFFKVNFRTGIVGWLNMSSVSVVPIALSAPKFFAGTATIGSLELVRQFYTQFYFALSWFPQSYVQLASWSANVTQLMEFKQDLEDNKIDITAKKPPSDAPAPAAAPLVPAVPAAQDPPPKKPPLNPRPAMP